MIVGATSSTPRVAASEAKLLELTRSIVHPSTSHIRSLRHRADPDQRVAKIGPTAMGLLERSLAQGVCYELLRRGGWQRRRTLVEGQPRTGRLWQRHRSLPALDFGPASFRLLAWLHDEDVGMPKRELELDAELGLGDELLHYLAAEQVIAAGGDLGQPAFRGSALCQLGFAANLVAAPEAEPVPRLDYRALTRGGGAIVLEAMQGDLARKWLTIEIHKQTIVSLDAMIALGEAQDQILAGLARAVDLVDPRRRDLFGFLAEFGLALLARGKLALPPSAKFWVGALDTRAPLSTRQRAFRAALAAVRGVLMLERWLGEAGLVAHFDEGYEAAQLLLSTWAPLRKPPEPTHRDPSLPVDTRTIFERAHALVDELESLHSLGISPAPPSTDP